MRIVVHAGLHKSGSTSVQTGWRAAFGKPATVWYPRHHASLVPGHHTAMWPLMDAFTEAQAPDLVWAHTLFRPDQPTLADDLRRARRKGVETLLLSTEELDRLQSSDVPRFRELLAGHEVTVVLTITRPMHRWCSGWQELVKKGLGEYPREAARHIELYGCLGRGRVEELVGLLDAHRRVVRVVRTSPPEDDLPRALADAVGVKWPEHDLRPSTRNTSLGTGIEVVLRMNRADLTLGTHGKAARLRLENFLESAGEEREVPGLAAHFEPPDELWDSARDEQDFLVRRAADAGVEVLDPHGLLPTWTDRTPPSWYEQISHRQRVVPGLPEPQETQELLWRVRQQRSALRHRLNRVERELAEMTASAESQSAELRELARLRERVDAMESSSSWRITAPLRAAGRALRSNR